MNGAATATSQNTSADAVDDASRSNRISAIRHRETERLAHRGLIGTGLDPLVERQGAAKFPNSTLLDDLEHRDATTVVGRDRDRVARRPLEVNALRQFRQQWQRQVLGPRGNYDVPPIPLGHPLGRQIERDRTSAGDVQHPVRCQHDQAVFLAVDRCHEMVVANEDSFLVVVDWMGGWWARAITTVLGVNCRHCSPGLNPAAVDLHVEECIRRVLSERLWRPRRPVEWFQK